METILKQLIRAGTPNTANWEEWIWNFDGLLTLAEYDTILFAKDPSTKARIPRPGYADPTKPTPEEISAQKTYDDANRQVAAWLRTAAGQEHRHILEKTPSDGVAIYDALFELYAKKDESMRFRAWNELLSIRKQSTESWADLVKRVDDATHALDRLRPADWDIQKETEELKAFTLLNAIPTEHQLRTSIVVSNTINYNKIKTAMLLFTTTTPESQDVAPEVAAAVTTPSKCLFCLNIGHFVKDCRTMVRFQQMYLNERAERRAGTSGTQPHRARGRSDRSSAPGRSHQAHAAQAIDKPTEVEYAGNASLSQLPVPTAADSWIADSGASCHMTHRREWLTGFLERRTPVKLADGSITFGTGRGMVTFRPLLDGNSTVP
ncbi:hypothetical protein PIIN_09632 [Serendipita indica DSM 11827]|uniref:Retrovirus-related Pol polyprotein from transposon TNT 1-94-like beta-barrel domain-containing protein n=1 Tax=Serendipita indica (strain DSM 11827) TaxID=1109443 RepID=G4TWE8_SERID|nr:hypothetical protein PIIN_09632 [Serendipita indica DSM 11827]